MGVGDASPDGDGFSLGAKPKRKKITSTSVTNDENLDAQLLSSNTFISLANQSQASNSSTPVISSAENSRRKEKLPPLVVKNISFTALNDKLATCGVPLTYKITRFGTRVNCNSVDAYIKVQNQLKQCQLEYYTYDRPSEKPYRAVIRGLPLVDPKTVIVELKNQHGLDVQAAHIIRRKEGSEPQNEAFYLLHFPKGYTNLKKLRELKQVGQVIVRWEAYRSKRVDVTQCMNCLHHGHGTRNCHLKSRCNNCAGDHSSETCVLKESPKRCANCEGNHPASDHSCPKRAEYVRIRQKATTQNQPGRKTNRTSHAAPALTQENFPALPNTSAPADPPKYVRQQLSTPGTTHRVADPRTRTAFYANSLPTNPSTEGTEEVLYSSAELWNIFTEFCGRLKQCKSRSDQVKVLGYMVCKYGVN